MNLCSQINIALLLSKKVTFLWHLLRERSYASPKTKAKSWVEYLVKSRNCWASELCCVWWTVIREALIPERNSSLSEVEVTWDSLRLFYIRVKQRLMFIFNTGFYISLGINKRWRVCFKYKYRRAHTHTHTHILYIYIYSRVGTISSVRPDLPYGPPSLLYNGYRVFTGSKVGPGRAAEHSPPSSAAVMAE